MDTQVTLFRAALAALAFLTSTCGDQPGPDSVELQRPAVALAVGGASQLNATARDERGRVIPGATFVWASANRAIAEVSSTGVVSGVTPGTVDISATRGGAAVVSQITVTGAAGPPLVTGDVSFVIDGSATYPISRFIYGGNVVDEPGSYANARMPAEFTFNRLGGNRATAYNWENNYSSAGKDFKYWNTADEESGTKSGGTVRRHADPTFARGQAFMATVPMSGYVSADACGCDVGITSADRTKRLATHFRVSRATKGSAFTLSPNTSDVFVYQDEFVNWFEKTYPGRSGHATAPVFFSLDNEPDLWHETHEEIFSDLNDNPKTPRLQTYAGFAETSIVYASAIKSVLPSALVFGPATATYTGITLLGRYPTPDPVHGTQNFIDIYLDRMRAAETKAGRRLLDVLDVHFYSEGGTSAGAITNDYAPQDAAMIEARVQAPRSLWDPTYNDGSWVTNVTGGPIRLLPRLREQVAAHYPGTKLAITEYYYGRGGDISGGVAQADVFGIFGREGVFAASLWPLAGIWAEPYKGDGNKAYAYIFGALRMYRNYDGAGGTFGDIGLKATTTDDAVSSVYASRNAAGSIVLIAINKTNAPKVASIVLRNVAGVNSARTYVLSAASATPVRQADLVVTGGAVSYAMPAMSVTTLVAMP